MSKYKSVVHEVMAPIRTEPRLDVPVFSPVSAANSTPFKAAPAVPVVALRVPLREMVYQVSKARAPLGEPISVAPLSKVRVRSVLSLIACLSTSIASTNRMTTVATSGAVAILILAVAPMVLSFMDTVKPLD